jgi:hypothetical protein
VIALKLSLAIFLLRVLVTRWQRWIIATTIALSTTFGVGYFFFAIFQCGYFYNINVFIHRMVRGQCASMSVGLGINYTYAALVTTSDWSCVIIPIFVLRESTMPLRRKLVVGGLMIFASVYVFRTACLDHIPNLKGQRLRRINRENALPPQHHNSYRRILCQRLQTIHLVHDRTRRRHHRRIPRHTTTSIYETRRTHSPSLQRFL